jgi:beta-lactamase superfamily II metal-dependent hydrolase
LFGAARPLGFAALAALTLAAGAGAAQTLDIYFIDVDGGQSTLIVTPAGQSLLIDTGYAGNDGRDARRIIAAARDAGVSRIDYLLITHFHTDHDGGIGDLAPQIPIGTFVDHGGLGDPGTADPTSQVRGFETYASIRKHGQHIEPKPGDRIGLKSVDVVVVSSDRATLGTPLSGGGQANAACAEKAPDADEPQENPRSTGIVLRFGRFTFVDLGDLTGAPLFALFCPRNLIGQADVYLVPHHGGKDVAHAAYIAAIRPRVAVMNNGATKGGAAETFAMLHQARSAGGNSRLEDVWQIDRSRNSDARNFPDDRIANLDEATGYWIKVSASQDGSFQVTNQRTGASKAYSRPAR